MRWKQKNKQVEIDPMPEQGAVKWKVHFAIFPVKIINKEWLWLEWYKTLYRWTTRQTVSSLGYYHHDRPRYTSRTGWHFIRREALNLDQIK